MSCLTTSATRRSRIVPAAALIASAAASSHDVLLVPMISVTRYTLMTLSSRRQDRAWHLAQAASRAKAGGREEFASPRPAGMTVLPDCRHRRDRKSVVWERGG